MYEYDVSGRDGSPTHRNIDDATFSCTIRMHLLESEESWVENGAQCYTGQVLFCPIYMRHSSQNSNSNTTNHTAQTGLTNERSNSHCTRTKRNWSLPKRWLLEPPYGRLASKWGEWLHTRKCCGCVFQGHFQSLAACVADLKWMIGKKPSRESCFSVTINAPS